MRAVNETLNDFYVCKTNIGKALCDSAYVQFSHGQHTGVDVNVYSMGPLAKQFSGNINNIDVCSGVAKYLNLEMGGDPPK